MKLKFKKNAFCFFPCLLIVFYANYEDLLKFKSLNYFFNHMFDRSYREGLLIIFILFIMFLGILSIEVGYDKKNGIIYSSVFWKKKIVDCSEIRFLVYVGGSVGDVCILGDELENLMTLSKIFNKKKFLKLFATIKQDYSNIEIIS